MWTAQLFLAKVAIKVIQNKHVFPFHSTVGSREYKDLYMIPVAIECAFRFVQRNILARRTLHLSSYSDFPRVCLTLITPASEEINIGPQVYAKVQL